MNDPWAELEATLTRQYSLPHNRAWAALHGGVEGAVRKVLQEIRSGVGAQLRRVEFRGPRVFLRVAGPGNLAYGGGWWFDADLFQRLERSYGRIYFEAADRRRAIRDMLREVLAVSTEWNPMTEVWALELAPGLPLVGYAAPGRPQKLFHGLPLSEEGNRMLVGQAEQIFLPVKNPFDVKKYASLEL